VGGEKRRIMYNATPKNGKPFVINEIRSSIHISTMLSFEGARRERVRARDWQKKM
jgi:hypothetical protein